MKESTPNLFIIGSMKSGTTSLHEYLDMHRDIYMSSTKEPGYFVEEKNYSKGKDWYLSLFSDVNNEKYIGESSTHYTKLPTYKDVPKRIREFCQSPRLIYIMRDPIDRTISHYWHNVRREGEHRSLINALKANSEYTDFSYYAMQLRPYINTFSRDNIYTLTLEKLVTNPQSELKSLLTWLDLDYKLLKGDTRKRHNELPENFERVKGLGLLYRFRHSSTWEMFAQFTPKRIRKWGASLSIKESSRDDTEVGDAIQYLQELQKARVNELCILLDREFPEWTTTMAPVRK